MKFPNFEKQELKDILISTLALGFIFTYPQLNFTILSIYTIVIAFSFIPHELAHKFAAMKYGAYARFEMFKQGLIFALVLAVVTNGGFVFAAPGAVMIYTQFRSHAGIHQIKITQKDNAFISAVGPGINIAIALLFVIVSFLFPGGFMAVIASVIVRVNVFLALFNLLPIMPFDGSKIYAWNKSIWFLMAGFVFLLWQII
ncbi:MAG: site-2 protease family protein [Candidatus Aenigmarchaeota archaeon]|nr:site-2 protease family protein [Candidatus Aenigmarchaeota archaeon]